MTEQLNGLELRKAALTAAGWEARQITPVWTDLFDNVGDFILGGTGNVWDDAPPVELSVDEALRWLTLEDGIFFVMEGPTKGPRFGSPAYAAIRDIHNPIKALVQAYYNESLAVAMCQAYLDYKSTR